MDKSKNFLDRKDDLQNAANSVLNWLNSVNWITNIIWIDLVWEITKPPEKRSFM